MTGIQQENIVAIKKICRHIDSPVCLDDFCKTSIRNQKQCKDSHKSKKQATKKSKVKNKSGKTSTKMIIKKQRAN